MWTGIGALPNPVSSFNYASSCQLAINVPLTNVLAPFDVHPAVWVLL